jgi:LAS superfamily LD-carboxypeptidase LdcB
MATKAEKDFFDFIQGKIKKNYKYLGFSVYNLTADDIGKLKALGDKWGIPFEWLCNLMNHESAGTFNPAIKNSIGATGLIQFLTSTAKSLGTTTSALASLSFQGQLEWVDKYLDGWKSTWKKRKLMNGDKVNDNFQQPDLFMTIFYPAAIGKPNFEFPSNVSKANGGIKTPMDYAKKALNHPPFPLDEVPSTLPEYRKKVGEGGDVGNLPSGESGTTTTTAETPVVNTTPPIPSIPKIEEMGIKFNVEQKDIFKALNAKYNFGDLSVIQEVAEDEMFVFQEPDTMQISSEYVEGVFSGDEEAALEYEAQEEFDEAGAADAAAVVKTLESAEVVNNGNWKLDLIPGEFVTNGGTKIKCCQINGAAVNVKIAPAFLDMRAAAEKDGIKITISSAFRSPYDSISAKSESGVKVSASSQQYLYDLYLAGKGNLAAKPGGSNHGNGIGLDLNAGGKSKGRFINVIKDNYIWLVKNSWKYGFIRSVAAEEWHYDYLPDLAKKGPYGKLSAADTGSVKTKFYKDWGLDNLTIT